MRRKIRILVAKPGLDGHDRGVLVLCEAFREAGMEVIYTGVHQTPEMIVATALAEDVDLIALSLLDGLHMEIFPRIMSLLKEREATEICVVGGGIIGEEDKPALEALGISGNFGPGTHTKVIIDHIVKRVKQERWGDRL